MMEGAGPEAGPGDKTPGSWAWMQQMGSSASTPPSVSSVPRIHSSWDPSVMGGWRGGQSLLGLRGACRRRCRGPTGASPLTRGCSYTPKPSRKLRGSPLLSTVQPVARRDHRTPTAAQMGGRAPVSGSGGNSRSAATVGPGNPTLPPAGRAPLRTVLASRRSGRPQATRCSLGREKVGGDTQRPESQEGGTRRGRGGKSGRVRRLRAARWGPATPRSPAPPPGFRPERLGQRRLGTA